MPFPKVNDYKPLQPLVDRKAADARLQPFKSRVVFYSAGFIAFISVALVVFTLFVTFLLTSGPDSQAMAVDFRVFWAAGKLALAGEPLAVNDMTQLDKVHGVLIDEYMPWLYPPGYLVLMTPLGTMSYPVAFLVWTVLSLGLIVWAFRPFVAGIGPLWVLVSLAPAYYPTIMLGQNSLLWMAGLLAGFAALRDGRWLLAGLFFGLLTLKPQLGLLIPFALLAVGAWRTIFVAGVTTVILAVVPSLVYGFEFWPLLQLSLAEHADRLVFSVDQILLMISPAFMLTFYGVENDLAWTLHWVIAAASVVAVIVLWRSKPVAFDTRLAGLLCAMMLSAPYLWYYEGVLLVAIALFMLRGGVLKPRPLHFLVLVPLWIGCGLQAPNTFFLIVEQRWLGAAVISPLLILCLILCLRQIKAVPRSDQGTA